MVNHPHRSKRPKWQPIETAPKDGSEFLAYWRPIKGEPQTVVAKWLDGGMARGFVGVNVRWLDGSGSISTLSGGFPITELLATHWMPLPPPPEAS